MTNEATIRKNLEKTKEELIPYWISCDLEEEDITLGIDKLLEIKNVLEFAKKISPEWEYIDDFKEDIKKLISDSIIEDIIHFTSEESVIREIVSSTIDNQNELYSDYMNYWNKKLKVQPVDDYQEVGKFLQKNIDDLYFSCVFSRTFGETYIESQRGKTNNFIMWRDIIIWDNLILEVSSGEHKGLEKNVIKRLFELLEVECFSCLSTNEFDEIKDYYKIIGIKIP